MNRRLPDTARPLLYSVVHHIDLDSAPTAFWGTVNITLAVTRPTNHLVIHAANALALSDVSMVGDDGRPIAIAAVWRWTPFEYLVLNFSSTVQQQSAAQLNIAFRAPLTANGLAGLYLAYYTNSTGRRVNMAVTQFESTDARRAFPCFDEPAFKAQFAITIHASSALPDGAVQHARGEGRPPRLPVRDWVQTQFQTSVVMSTYLVAMVVCDFAYTERRATCGDGIPSRVYAPAHLINSTIVPARIAADVDLVLLLVLPGPVPAA